MSKTEKRTQIYLTAEQHRAAMEMARKKGTSMAGVVREALSRYLVSDNASSLSWEDDPVFDLVGALELPPIDDGLSLNDAIDSSVYDE